jgi:hypothetical protein
MDHEFVLLSAYDQKPDLERLSLQEMWCSLVLQTLPLATLRTYLPNNSYNLAPWAGKQLNVSPPILQVFMTSALPDDTELSEHIDIDLQTPLVLQYPKENVKRFQDLRNSDNPIFRQYYHETMEQARTKAFLSVWERLSRELQHGREVAVGSYRERGNFTVNRSRLVVPVSEYPLR